MKQKSWAWENVGKLVIFLDQGHQEIQIDVYPNDTVLFTGFQDPLDWQGFRPETGRMTVGTLFRRLTRVRKEKKPGYEKEYRRVYSPPKKGARQEIQ